MADKLPAVPLYFRRLTAETQRENVDKFYANLDKRRSVREFSDEAVPLEIIEKAILVAGTAPSGAHLQPWRFVVVKDATVKSKIRAAAEAEEYESYHHRMPSRWLNRLAPLGTDEHKPFLEIAPYLIIVFRLTSFPNETTGELEPTYYSQESVGIAVGMLLVALHTAGLATLTHTPSPMKFLNEVLNRPKNEVPFVLIPVGYPAESCRVPDIKRKMLAEIMEIV
jgi:iodotyrosine deiodinase